MACVDEMNNNNWSSAKQLAIRHPVTVYQAKRIIALSVDTRMAEDACSAMRFGLPYQCIVEMLELGIDIPTNVCDMGYALRQLSKLRE